MLTETTSTTTATPQKQHRKTAPPFAWFLVILSYTLSALAGWLTLSYLADYSLIVRFAAADVVATLIIFAFSAVFNNSSFYDPYWSIIPVLIVLALLLFAQPEVNTVRAGLTIFLVSFWGLRLTYNWARQWTGLDHEDWRYIDLRQSTGKAYWLVSFSGIHMFPTVLVFMGCLPLFYANISSNTPLNVFDFLGFAITLGAILIEAIADQQLRNFVLTRKSSEELLDKGLWAYARHPNYFGEVAFWVGIYFFGLACSFDLWWTGVGALSMILLFVFISLPMIDKRMLSRKPNYAEHMRKVSSIVPWFPKK